MERLVSHDDGVSAARMETSGVGVRLWMLAAIGLAIVIGYHRLLFSHAPMMFNDPKEDMSFAWYVPLFSLYVVWKERAKLLETMREASWGGAVAAIPFLFLGFLGTRGIQVRLEMVAFAGLLLTVPWAFFGYGMAKRLAFPVCFLLFCVPMASFLDIVTVHLRIFATGTAEAILRGAGVGVVRTGTMLATSGGAFAIDVADPCSGLRSIFALMALTAGYAYFTQPTCLRRAILFSLSIPLAVAGNVMRILSIVMVGTYASGPFAMGFYHDYSGYVVFIVAIFLMVVCGETISKVCDR